MTTTDTLPVPRHADSTPTVHLPVPGLGTVELSRPELVFVGGIVALSVFGLLEWPIALVMGAGHLLAADRSNRAAQALGASMEEAA